jgi:hypothetical protein
MPFDNTLGFQTAFAIANEGCVGPGNCGIPIEMVFFDQSGNKLTFNGATATGPWIPNHGHLSMFLTEIAAIAANQKGFVRISSLGPPISAIGLRFNPSGSFTSIPISRPN